MVRSIRENTLFVTLKGSRFPSNDAGKRGIVYVVSAGKDQNCG